VSAEGPVKCQNREGVVERVVRILVLGLVLSSALSVLRAEEVVHFADPKLKTAVEGKLFISDPTATDMLALTQLVIPTTPQRLNAISDLSGLEYAANLTDLNLRYHRVSDLSPLSGLIHLCAVDLLGNGLSDISPLSRLTELESLDLESNEVSDISALAGLPNLASVCLHRCFVRDISPLTTLTSLKLLDLRALPLNQEAYDTYIPRIKASNPGVTLYYDKFFAGQLVISSSAGGSVIAPGEGTFAVTFGETWLLEAKAEAGYVFASWSGTRIANQNPLPLKVDGDYTVRANFESVLHVLHVDDNAPVDPGPGDSAVSDPQENGTVEHPFDSICEAIDIAAPGAIIVVHAGTYRETVDFLGKRIELTGFDPNDSSQAAWPVIDGDGKGPVVSFTHGEDQSCLLTGFVITGGMSRTGGAVHCMISSPTISNCLIAGNRVTGWNGAAVLCADSRATFINCTIADNRAGQFGAGLAVVNGQVTMVNSILWGNWPREIAAEGDHLPSIRYSLVAGGWPGTGNLTGDPLFAGLGRWVDRRNPGTTVTPGDPNAIWVAGNYHVQSQAGRWDPVTAIWVQDPVASPCIDAGDPAAPVGHEPSPNGGVINLGVYGGTTEASRSVSLNPSP
jgi:hypothetical protein